MQGKSALIIGGAGFIGTHLARQLGDLAIFSHIVSLDIQQPKRPLPRVIYNNHDVRRPIHETIDGYFDIVFNLAATHRTPGHPDAAYYETNVAGALNCTAFCERNDITNLLFTSSISVYGPSEAPLDESSPLNPSSAYGGSKRLAESIHRQWYERGNNRRLTIVRPAVVFGEGEEGNYSRLARMLSQGTFVYPGRTDTLKAGGYVKELVRTMLFALQRPERFYLYNFADRHCPTANEISAALQALGGFRAPLAVLPLPLMQAVGLCFEALNVLGMKNGVSRARIAKLVHSTNIVPRRLIEDGYPFAYNLQSALSDWMASDDELRPAKSKARAVSVAQPNFDPAWLAVSNAHQSVRALRG